MSNETNLNKPTALPKRSLLNALALGLYLAWWNLYHDDGFLFLDGFLNQVESCVICYAGALLACVVVLILKKSLPISNRKRELALLAVIQLILGCTFYVSIASGSLPGILLSQLCISTSFFIVVFEILKNISKNSLKNIALCIAIGMGFYGAVEAFFWLLSIKSTHLILRFSLHCGLLFAGFATALRALKIDSYSCEKSQMRIQETRARRLPFEIVAHVSIYWFIFGTTHAMASGVVPTGHDKLLPCYIGSIAAGIAFYCIFARKWSGGQIWPKVRIFVFPLTMLSFLLLPFANSGFTFISIGFAQCAMDVYFCFYLLTIFVVAPRINSSFSKIAIAATLLAAPSIIAGVVTGDMLKSTLISNPFFYNALSIAAFLALTAGTFWVGDDRQASLVWGLEKKLTPKHFKDKTIEERCERAISLYGLTKREGEILVLLAQGHNASSISKQEVISLNTARTHISRIHRKMDVHSQQELQERIQNLAPKSSRPHA